MQSYQKSANVVINEKDLEKLGGIFKKSISENELFIRSIKTHLMQSENLEYEGQTYTRVLWGCDHH
jgi:hypothetical protein